MLVAYQVFALRAGALSSYLLVASVIDSADFITIYFHNSIGNDLTLFEHARAVGLNHCSVAIDVDDETRQAIAFAVYQPINRCVGIIRKTQQLS